MKKVIYLIALVGIIIDQLSKLLVSKFLTQIKIIHNFFSLTYVENKGGAWGILDNNVFLLIIVSVVTLLIISKYIKNEDKISRLSTISYGLLIGGIFGNLFDRIFRGFVVDFLDFKLFGYNFPVFNIADTMIVIGVIIMLIDVVGDMYGNKSRRK